MTDDAMCSFDADLPACVVYSDGGFNLRPVSVYMQGRIPIVTVDGETSVQIQPGEIMTVQRSSPFCGADSTETAGFFTRWLWRSLREGGDHDENAAS